MELLLNILWKRLWSSQPTWMTEVVGCRSAIDILHLVKPIVQINPVECMYSWLSVPYRWFFPCCKSFYGINIVYTIKIGSKENFYNVVCDPSAFIENFHATAFIPEPVMCSQGYILYPRKREEKAGSAHTHLSSLNYFVYCLSLPQPPLETYFCKGKTFHLFCSLLHPQCLEQCCWEMRGR